MNSNNNNNNIESDISTDIIKMSDINDAINLEKYIESIKWKIDERLKNSFLDSRNDNLLLNKVNKYYKEYYLKYKESYEKWDDFFWELNTINISKEFQFNNILKQWYIENEKDFAIFMFKVTKLFIFLIDNKKTNNRDRIKIENKIEKLFLKFIVKD
jgi:hypothetical protein